MDPYDEAQHHQHHPSHSIPNAAYPDSPYRPGEGQQDATASPSHAVSGNSSSSLAFAPSHEGTHSPHTAQQNQQNQQHQQGQWPDAAMNPSNLAIPQGPPPPYDPSRTPTSYSPLDVSPSASHRPDPSSHQVGIPLQDMTPVASTGQYQSQQQWQQHHPVLPTPHGSGASTLSDKLDPVTAARLRKKRRMKICLVITGAVVIFLTALMIGVGLGVIRQALHSGDDEDDGPDHDHDY
jgi:hypothetical protein